MPDERGQVTLMLDRVVWRKFRVYALLNDRTASALIEEFLRELVDDDEEEGSNAPEDLGGLGPVEESSAPSVRYGDDGNFYR